MSLGSEKFKFVCTRDENLQDSINERLTIGNHTLEPKLNLVNQNDNYAKMDHLSYLQRGQNYPVTSMDQRI